MAIRSTTLTCNGEFADTYSAGDGADDTSPVVVLVQKHHGCRGCSCIRSLGYREYAIYEVLPALAGVEQDAEVLCLADGKRLAVREVQTIVGANADYSDALRTALGIADKIIERMAAAAELEEALAAPVEAPAPQPVAVVLEHLVEAALAK